MWTMTVYGTLLALCLSYRAIYRHSFKFLKLLSAGSVYVVKITSSLVHKCYEADGVISEFLSAVTFRRRRLTPPVTRRALLIHAAYWAGTALCNAIGIKNLREASNRARDLMTLNTVPLILGDRLDLIADILAISQRTYKIIHESLGVMVFVQTCLHVTFKFIDQQNQKTLLHAERSLIVRFTQQILSSANRTVGSCCSCDNHIATYTSIPSSETCTVRDLPQEPHCYRDRFCRCTVASARFAVPENSHSLCLCFLPEHVCVSRWKNPLPMLQCQKGVDTI